MLSKSIYKLDFPAKVLPLMNFYIRKYWFREKLRILIYDGLIRFRSQRSRKKTLQNVYLLVYVSVYDTNFVGEAWNTFSMYQT